MRVLVIGSGGREHAICWAFSRCAGVEKVFCADGNAGIAGVAERVDVSPTAVMELAEFAAAHDIGLTFVGGESALALGIVDEFRRRGLRIIGADRAGARLESSKAFAKDFMSRHGIPTARSAVAESGAEAEQVLESGFFGGLESPVVVKADGLAAGKGVVVAESRDEAVAAIRDLASVAGDAASRIVLEERLVGREVSLLLFADGRDFAMMPPVRDHKRIFDGDKGPNTGGMGTIADASLLTDSDTDFISERIVRPTLDGCAAEGFPFKGILFIGLMMTPEGPKVLEYNTRFGDPETQVIMRLLETDLTDICMAVDEGSLRDLEISWSKDSAACVVLASRGYPAGKQVGDVIYGLDIVEGRDGVVVFHAGTAVDGHGNIVTAGGRVLGVTARAPRLGDALDGAYRAVNDISWNGMHYRRDIGTT
jgi:phosphoribosylamine--glycine ligase